MIAATRRLDAQWARHAPRSTSLKSSTRKCQLLRPDPLPQVPPNPKSPKAVFNAHNRGTQPVHVEITLVDDAPKGTDPAAWDKPPPFIFNNLGGIILQLALKALAGPFPHYRLFHFLNPAHVNVPTQHNVEVSACGGPQVPRFQNTRHPTQFAPPKS